MALEGDGLAETSERAHRALRPLGVEAGQMKISLPRVRRGGQTKGKAMKTKTKAKAAAKKRQPNEAGAEPVAPKAAEYRAFVGKEGA